MTLAAKTESFFYTIERGEALRTAALFALLLMAAFYNVVFLGESLVPGNNLNPLAYAATPENYGPHSHPQAYFDARGVFAYANIHDPGGSWWQGEPGSELLQRSLMRGEFPLWDPYIGGGAPSMANLIPAYFFPPSFLVAVAGNEPWLKNLYILLLFLAAGFFTYVFLRKHGASALASRAAGIAFMFSGAVVQTAPEFVGQAVVGIPIVLAATACLLHRPTWPRTIVTAFVYGCIALASFPPILVFAFGLAVVYAAVVIALDRGGAGRPLLAARFISAAVLSLALVAFYYVPAAFVIREARQASRFYHNTGLQRFQRRQIFQLLSPALVAAQPMYEIPIVYTPNGNLFYFGVTGLLLAGATFGRFKPFPLLFFQIVAALLLLKIFGVPPIQAIGKLPLFNSMHIAYYGGILLGFLLACCTGLAIDLLLQRRLLLVSCAGAVLVMAGAFLLLLKSARGDNLLANPQRWRWEADYRLALLFLGIAAVLLFGASVLKPRAIGMAMVALLAVEGITNASFPRQPRWNYWDHPPQYVRALAARPTLQRVLPLRVLPANTNSPYAIGSVDSLFTFNSERYTELHHRYFGSPDGILARECSLIPADPVLDAFAVDRIVIDSSFTRLHTEGIKRGFIPVYADARVLLLQRPSAPRYFLTRDYAVTSRQDAFYEFPRRPPHRLLLEHAPGFPPDPHFAGGTVKVERFGLNSYRLRVSSPVPALLSMSEAHFPGWTALVNGRRTPILPANYAFRAIEVPAGTSLIEMSYWPPGMTAGMMISAMALSIAAAAMLYARRHHDHFADVER